MPQALIALAVALIVFLASYACFLLYKLRLQNQRKRLLAHQRYEKTADSIRVIALAMAQQQCNLSEGCIRLVRLLESLPFKQPATLSGQYPGVYALYQEVKDLPTHARRNELSRAERNRQDTAREEKEAEYSTLILTDVTLLRNFAFNPKVNDLA